MNEFDKHADFDPSVFSSQELSEFDEKLIFMMDVSRQIKEMDDKVSNPSMRLACEDLVRFEVFRCVASDLERNYTSEVSGVERLEIHNTVDKMCRCMFGETGWTTDYPITDGPCLGLDDPSVTSQQIGNVFRQSDIQNGKIFTGMASDPAFADMVFWVARDVYGNDAHQFIDAVCAELPANVERELYVATADGLVTDLYVSGFSPEYQVDAAIDAKHRWTLGDNQSMNRMIVRDLEYSYREFKKVLGAAYSSGVSEDVREREAIAAAEIYDERRYDIYRTAYNIELTDWDNMGSIAYEPCIGMRLGIEDATFEELGEDYRVYAHERDMEREQAHAATMQASALPDFSKPVVADAATIAHERVAEAHEVRVEHKGADMSEQCDVAPSYDYVSVVDVTLPHTSSEIEL